METGKRGAGACEREGENFKYNWKTDLWKIFSHPGPHGGRKDALLKVPPTGGNESLWGGSREAGWDVETSGGL